MVKKFLTASLLTSLLAGSSLAAENIVTGVVNFATCFTDSKHGKKEQENFESLRKQMASYMETTEGQLKEIATKFEDSEYMDSLSPKAEEELKMKFQSLQEELGRYQNQFYQVLNHANHQMIQKVNTAVSTAAKQIAEKNKLDYVINKEFCFYIRPDLDVTAQVITEMDKKFDLEAKSNKLSENNSLDINSADLLNLNKAN